MSEKILYGIIPQALTGNELLGLIQKTIKNNELPLNAHNYFDTLSKNNEETLEWNGLIYISDISAEGYGRADFQLNFIGYDIDNFKSKLSNIYPNERTIISFSANNKQGIDIVNNLLEMTGGYLIYDKDKTITYPVTSLLNPSSKRKFDIYNMQKDINTFFNKYKDLFTPQNKEFLYEDIMTQLIENIAEEPTKRIKSPEI